MQGGTGLSGFAAQFPSRFLMWELRRSTLLPLPRAVPQRHTAGIRGLLHLLQRSYDQILNDTAILGQHIVLAVDRAGIVPDDGETHQGIFDVPFLYTIPGVTIYSPASFDELRIHLKQALYDAKGIAVVRYPKGGELPPRRGIGRTINPIRCFADATPAFCSSPMGALRFPYWMRRNGWLGRGRPFRCSS